jgi:L,D-transpeptidase catalytic domain
MRRFAFAFALAAFLFGIHSAHAGLLVHIDKSRQRMTVAAGGSVLHSWAVSTGRAGYGTPNGTYRPQRLARRWFSRKYYNSPMPHSIFFNGGFAIHGSYEIRRLGGPASHGCVRLHPVHAATLYGLVQRHGMESTRIVVAGAIPATRARTRWRQKAPRWQYEPPPYRYDEPHYYYYTPGYYDWEG